MSYSAGIVTYIRNLIGFGGDIISKRDRYDNLTVYNIVMAAKSE